MPVNHKKLLEDARESVAEAIDACHRGNHINCANACSKAIEVLAQVVLHSIAIDERKELMRHHLSVVPKTPIITAGALYVIEKATPRQVHLFLFSLSERKSTQFPLAFKWKDEIEFVADAQDLATLMTGIANTHHIP